MFGAQNMYGKERGGEDSAFLVPCCFVRGETIGRHSLRHRAVGSGQKAFSQSTELGGQRGVTAEPARFFSM